MTDWTGEISRHVEKRLHDDLVIWLTTVGDDEGPHPRPVWFVWTGDSFTIYSQPNTWKLRHISHRPRVSLHLNSDEAGDDVVVFLGQASIIEGGLPADRDQPYLKKYRQGMANLGMSPEEFARDYSVAVRVTPTGFRGG
jgi:PPOX class probable F420-dependent enzyme